MTASAAPQPLGGSMDIATVLDQAIAQLRAGVPLERCLAAHPAQAADLRPLLELAAFTMQVAPAAPLPGARARVRATVRAAAEEHLARRPWWELGWLQGWRLRPAGLAAAGAAALLALGGGGAVVAAANALPGEPLYAVKLATEDTRLALAAATGKPEAQAQVHREIADRRLAEAKLLADQGRPVPPGLIESALRQRDAADKKVAQLPEPQRAQAAAKLETTQAQRTDTLRGVQDTVPDTAKPAIAHALEEDRQKHAGGTADDRTTVALPPGSGNGARGGDNTAATMSRTSPGASAREDERQDDTNGAQDERPEDRPGEGNGRAQGRGRPAAAGEAGIAQPGLRDVVLGVATALESANGAGGGPDQSRGGQDSPDSQADPPPALPRLAPSGSSQRDDGQRGNEDRGRSSSPPGVAPEANPAANARPAAPGGRGAGGRRP